MTGILEKNNGPFRFLMFLLLVLFEKESPEVFCKKVFLKILRILEENTCTEFSEIFKGTLMQI